MISMTTALPYLDRVKKVDRIYHFLYNLSNEMLTPEDEGKSEWEMLFIY